MIQVSAIGTKFTVLVDGVPHGNHDTRGEAVAAALKLKEDHS